MRRALLATVVLAASALALPAAAQTSGYLNWAGRPEPVPQQAAQATSGAAWRLSNGHLNAPGRLPHGGYDQRNDAPQYGLTVPPGTRGDSLTPASDWVQPQPMQMATPVRRGAYRTTSSPAQAYMRRSNDDAYYRDMREAAVATPVQPTYAGDAPAMQPRIDAAPVAPVSAGPVYADSRPAMMAPAPSPVRAAAVPNRVAPPTYAPPPPSYAPPGRAPEYIPADARAATAPSTMPAPAAEVDPMAPRRDAPIFRIQRDQAEASPGQQPSRRYSVHRQNGQEPDPAQLPEGGYIDGLAISMPETLASEDLARPPDPPVLTRDNQGRVRAMPAPSEGDHQ